MDEECDSKEVERLRDRIRELEALEAGTREGETSLRKEREAFLGFIDRAPYGVFRMSRKGTTVYLNQRFTAVTGYTVADVPNGRTLLRKAFPNKRYRHEVFVQWRPCIEQGTDAVLSVVCRDGSTKEVEFRPTVFEDGGLVLMIFDVTDRKRWEDAIRHMAYHDALTDLPNRTLLSDLLGRTLARAKREHARLGLILIDLDNLKETNDRHGHPAGDLLLRSVASRVKAVLRVTDTIARIGGDEFIVLLPSLRSPQDMVQKAEKIARAFEPPVSYQGQPLSLSASLGAALYPEDGQDAETLIAKADKAMYKAKRETGKKYFVPGR
jgi:diguanylate cyclase (GGDEF)-like protein/PAS domain S-box-containing protein